ncbi:outer membrane protein assembly factor BamD [Acinetobacter sp. ANC 4558]|uniref:outer membrane protein assembly factor BamD n=1 Tax=Acinetobacter sp. ANC 4558 TaxID=1977876 RepID=UPI000A342628|nr:outer membrane protein assembly factor BamD [Acinetobacter sp. ANC 4558]OTG87716.1 outer membrane protein assembly factor BamD [Acinetobacter sp. ANC 4558]
MSLPRYKITVLALAIGLATTFVGCSSNPKKEVVDKGPQSSEEVYIQKAEKALADGHYIDAAKNLEAIETYFPTGEYAQQAQLELMYAKFQQKEYESVITLADRFIRLNPQAANVDYAYYIRGVANMEQNYDGLMRYTSLKQSHRDVSYLKVAYQNFVDFVRRYPSSTYAVDAAQRMQYINTELAEAEINVARFNVKRKAWVAAIERAQWVIEHHPNAIQTPEALAIIAYSYDKLGDKATAQQYIDVLKLNYPNLVKADGSVNLRAAQKEASWVNRATLGLFGRDDTAKQKNSIAAPESIQKRSLSNRLSFGLLDKPEKEEK